MSLALGQLPSACCPPRPFTATTKHSQASRPHPQAGTVSSFSEGRKGSPEPPQARESCLVGIPNVAMPDGWHPGVWGGRKGLEAHGALLPSGHKCLLPPPLPTQPQPVLWTTLTNASALAGPTAAFAPAAWPRPPVL